MSTTYTAKRRRGSCSESTRLIPVPKAKAGKISEDHLFSVYDKEGNMVVGLKEDGSVNYGKGFTKKKAAKAFWESVSEVAVTEQEE